MNLRYVNMFHGLTFANVSLFRAFELDCSPIAGDSD